MLIKDLKEQLENIPDNLEVYLQTDPEGNGYYSVRGIDIAYRIGNNTYNPDIYCEEDIEDYQEDNPIKIAVVFP